MSNSKYEQHFSPCTLWYPNMFSKNCFVSVPKASAACRGTLTSPEAFKLEATSSFQAFERIWVFPQIGGFSPKWMVKIMENRWFGREKKTHYFWKHPYVSMNASTNWVFPRIGVFPPKSSILIGNHPLFSPSIFRYPLFLETPKSSHGVFFGGLFLFKLHVLPPPKSPVKSKLVVEPGEPGPAGVKK